MILLLTSLYVHALGAPCCMLLQLPDSLQISNKCLLVFKMCIYITSKIHIANKLLFFSLCDINEITKLRSTFGQEKYFFNRDRANHGKIQ